MKKLLFSALLMLGIPAFLAAQSYRIEGTWYTEEKTSTIEIKKAGNGTYQGKITWLDEPFENGKPKVDDENPDPNLRNRPLKGLTIVKNFRYDSRKKEFVDGSIYDPENGKTYDCYAWFENGNTNTLYLKGYVAGIRALGRKTTWTRKR